MILLLTNFKNNFIKEITIVNEDPIDLFWTFKNLRSSSQ